MPLSEPIIAAWNDLKILQLGRTVDYTDLFVLVVLPLTYFIARAQPTVIRYRNATHLLAIISVFAFTATSFSKKTEYQNDYVFPTAKKELVLQMGNMPKYPVFEWFNESDNFEVVFDNCVGQANITVAEANGQSIVRLSEIDYRCPGGGEKDEMRQFFESKFIEELRAHPGEKAPLIEYIWATAPPDWTAKHPPRDERYPSHWFAPINDPNKPAWEILPQEAKAGEVILSKRNELGILSNFAATPFELYGRRYASVEGFWQMMLYPEGTSDERQVTRGKEDKAVIWKHSRDQVAQMTAFEAKSAGTLAEENMKTLGIDWASFDGKRFPYRSATPGEHYKLILAAMRAKADQNPEVKRILLATGDLILKPDHHGEENPPPEWKYNEMWMQIRSDLQKTP